jgi:hypothetical protein
MSKDGKSLDGKERDEDTHPPHRAIRLKSSSDINRFLAKVINELYRDKMTPQKAGKLGFLCNVMLHSFECVDFAERLEEIEKQVQAQGQ